MASFLERGIHALTPNGLTMVGPACGDAAFPFAKAFNVSMAAIDARFAELEARIAQLEANKSAKK